MIKIRNEDGVPPHIISEQMSEPRPLPMGRTEFEYWADRIISGSLVPGPDGQAHDLDELKLAELDSPLNVFYNSLRNTLCALLLHIGPTESHKPDAYFIHALRVSAIKQVGVMISEEIRQKSKERLKGQQE